MGFATEGEPQSPGRQARATGQRPAWKPVAPWQCSRDIHVTFSQLRAVAHLFVDLARSVIIMRHLGFSE